MRTISFTEVKSSAKGLTATTTSESNEDSKSTTTEVNPTIRKRSSSFGVSPDDDIPSAMQISGSMNDFGLGCLSWW